MKKGFTLIELLAVIVILAIIALIATPIILGIINNAKKESQERSAELYLNGVELAIARKNLSTEFSPTECTITGVNTLDCDSGTLTVEVDGEVPTSGTIKFDNNKATSGTELNFEGFKATIENGKVTVGSASGEETGGNTGGNDETMVCKPATEKNAGYLVSEVQDKFSYGVTYTCDPGDGVERTFYVLEASSDNVSLIMDRNIVSDSMWLGEGKGNPDNNKPEDALAALKGQTTDKGWTVEVNMPTNAQINATKNSDNKLPAFLVVNIGVGSLPEEYDGYWTTDWSINNDECFQQSSTCNEEGGWDCYCVSPGVNANIVKPVYVDGEGFVNLGEIVERNAKYGSGVRPVITISKNQIDV